MDRLILGRYIPGDSLIHKLDPRSKLLAMILFLFIIFWANNLVTNAIILSFVLFLVFLSGIKFSFFLSGIRPMIGIILFTTLFQVFFMGGETLLFQFWIIKITLEGLQQAGIIFVRFVLIVIFSTLLTLTTTPLSLADGVEAGLAPLARLKVPVHEIGLMLSMSLRFVPTLMDDTTRIMNAQRARGVDFGEGTVVQKVKAALGQPLRNDVVVVAVESQVGQRAAQEYCWPWGGLPGSQGMSASTTNSPCGEGPARNVPRQIWTR